MPTPTTSRPSEFWVMVTSSVRSGAGSGVERRFTDQLDGDAVTAIERLDAGVADDLGGVAVPRARTGQLPSGSDLVDPLLELDVVRGDEALTPVLGNPDADAVVRPYDDLAGLSQRRGSDFADDLAADVVPVADVDRRLDVDQHPSGRPADHQQRVLQVTAMAVRPRGEHPDRGELLAEQPPCHVEVVHGGVDDRHVLRVLRGDGGVAVARVVDEGHADRARIDDSLQGAVRRVVPAHEADLYQSSPARHLRVHDVPACPGRGGQRILAET